MHIAASLRKKVEEIAREGGISVDQFIVAAVAEKTSAPLSPSSLEKRGRRGDRD